MRNDHKSGEPITRAQAWEDFKQDFPRMLDGIEAYVDAIRNVCRMVWPAGQPRYRLFARFMAIFLFFMFVAGLQAIAPHQGEDQPCQTQTQE